MSKRGKVVHEAAVIAERNFYGSFAHHSRLRHFVHLMIAFLFELGITPERLKNIPLWSLQLYAHALLSQGVSPATILNRNSGLRMILSRAGRDVTGTTPAEIGIPRRDRSGKKVPVTDAEAREIFSRAEKIDEGFALLLRVKLAFGLRSIEAIRSAAECGRKICTRRGGITRARRGKRGSRPWKKTRKRFVLITYLNSISHLFNNVFKNGKLLSIPTAPDDPKDPWFVPRNTQKGTSQRPNHHNRKNRYSKVKKNRG